MKIPLYQPTLGGRERELVLDCLDSNWISSKGKYVEMFQAEFAAYVGLSHGVAVCNGTVALHVALLALGIGEGDEVLVPTLTYVASVNAITYTGARPVFVDSERSSWQMDAGHAETLVTKRTRAILAVHLYGQACDLDALSALARRHNLLLIEDCAEAIGTYYGDRHVGSTGQVATFSFYGNKTITTGEGGMVVTADPELAARVLRLRGQGLARDGEYWHDIVGYNYRMTNVCAAIGVAQLAQVDQFLSSKRAIARAYADGLATLGYEIQPESVGTRHSYWMVSALAPDGEGRDSLRRHLADSGVETRRVFHPAHTLPMYRGATRYPVAEDLAARGFNLPSWPGLTDANVEFVVDRIREFRRSV